MFATPINIKTGLRTARDVIPPRREIRRFNDPAEPFRLLSGWAAQYHDARDGQRQYLALMLPGDMWQGQSPYGVMSITQCRIDWIKTSDELSPPDGGVDDFATLQNWLIAFATLKAKGRIAYLLLSLFARLHKKNLVRDDTAFIPLIQSDIGSICNLTPVHVNRTIRNIESIGAIARTGRDLTLLNYDILRELAGCQANDYAVPYSLN